MEQFFDNVARQLAQTTSRRQTIRILFGAVFGGAVTSACSKLTGPSCTDGCVGTDNVCTTCPQSGTFCTTRPDWGTQTCSQPTAGGVYCCATCPGCINSEGGCSTCSSGFYCTTNPQPNAGCGALSSRGVACCPNSGSGGGGGGSTRYYVSANGCAGGNAVSYSGYDYSTCNYYYQLAVYLSCSKIYDNCR
jgi:hypothetical protein